MNTFWNILITIGFFVFVFLLAKLSKPTLSRPYYKPKKYIPKKKKDKNLTKN